MFYWTSLCFEFLLVLAFMILQGSYSLFFSPKNFWLDSVFQLQWATFPVIKDKTRLLYEDIWNIFIFLIYPTPPKTYQMWQKREACLRFQNGSWWLTKKKVWNVGLITFICVHVSIDDRFKYYLFWHCFTVHERIYGTQGFLCLFQQKRMQWRSV